MINRIKIFVVAASLVVSTVAAGPAAAADPRTKQAGSDFGIGVVTVLANLVYMPVKVSYGLLGGITGGFAYVLSGANRDVADGVWVPSLGGDYVLTADMMTGHERVHFNGVREQPAAASGTAATPDYESSGSTF